MTEAASLFGEGHDRRQPLSPRDLAERLLHVNTRRR
jgi:hypothetical protein